MANGGSHASVYINDAEDISIKWSEAGRSVCYYSFITQHHGSDVCIFYSRASDVFP